MHLASEMYRDVTHMETVEIPDEFFDKSFIRHLMADTRKASMRKERVHDLLKKCPFHSFNSTPYRGDSNVYVLGATKYITNLKNHVIVKLERLIIRAVFALYPGISRKGIWAIINGKAKDRQHEDEVEFVDKKPSSRSTNENSLIRSVIHEHGAVLGLANPADRYQS